MSLLAFENVCVRLQGLPVLDGVSFRAGHGEFIGLLGPNGAGKSTLLRAALNLVPSSGAIHIDGRPTAELAAVERARRVAYIAQERDVAWSLSVETLVSVGRTPYRMPFRDLSRKDIDIIESAMRRMDILDLRQRLVTSLSGGERARVLIARALAQDTPLLLADEPTAGLDPAHQLALLKIFQELAQEGRTVLASMHELGLAAQGCERILLINNGTIVADGPPRSVFTAETLTKVYGINATVLETPGGLLVAPNLV